jgi:hypothetical protein
MLDKRPRIRQINMLRNQIMGKAMSNRMHKSAEPKGRKAQGASLLTGQGFKFYWWRPPLMVCSAGVCPKT